MPNKPNFNCPRHSHTPQPEGGASDSRESCTETRQRGSVVRWAERWRRHACWMRRALMCQRQGLRYGLVGAVLCRLGQAPENLTTPKAKDLFNS